MLFQRGDIVQLNSSGRRMVVEEVVDDAGTIIRCKWYEGRERYVDSFYVDGIRHYLAQH